MIKYLVKKQNTFWYRRKITVYGEIVFSLKTKNYDKAILRHSFIDYKIKSLVYQGKFETMTVQEIRNLIEKYKTYMLNEEYNDYENKRDEELSINIDGKFYGGHTQEALDVAIKKYKVIHEQNDIEIVKQETAKILKRSNFTAKDLAQLETEKDKTIFAWELFKTEWELLHQAYNSQKEVVKTTNTPFDASHIYAYQKALHEHHKLDDTQEQDLSISQLVTLYIDENGGAKVWSDKNERDILYVHRHLASYYDDLSIHKLKRIHFSEFRDKVLRNLPKQATKKEFRGKTTIEIIQITKDKKYDTISIQAINKHIRRLHQVYEWASITGTISKNLTKNLELTEKKKSKKAKSKKIPFSDNELKIIFEQSPWFTDKIFYELKNNPEHIFIPLLALYTGAKPTELATLKTSSIFLFEGIWVIDFNQMIKGADTERYTPIADALIDIGLLKYLNYQKKKKETLLFPSVKVYKSEGTSFTNDYSRYNREHISSDINKTFYSFRHLVNQKLKNKKVNAYIINDITGHSHVGGDYDQIVYGDEQMPEIILQEIINACLVYDIDFTHIKDAIHKYYS